MLLAERLMVVLKREIGHLENDSKENNPRRRKGGDGEPVECSDEQGAGPGGARRSARPALVSPIGRSKERIETLGQMTRSLEKLLDLVGLERRAAAPDGEDDAVERLREEMMGRLRSLDAKRGAVPGLFGDGSPAGGEGA